MMSDTLLFGGFGHNNFRWINLVFIPKNIQKWSFRKNKTTIYIFNYRWVYIMRDYGYALALGELYRPEQIGVFKYSLGKPKFGNFIIKVDRNFKNSSVFLT
ncbi:MAG: hypothetical protein CM15mP117_18240 [Alphaproteobacteria bacterium]|nr:MAG: hypothetical protein CM15mP117_18240 [Alphaproteobacteria bacterium]